MNTDRFKFRFYDKQCKMYLPDGHYINGDKWMDDYFEDVDDLPEYIVPEQCTGLKDKNGNLIYEGDVVSGRYFNPYHSKTPNPKIKGVVRFIQDRMIWIIKEGDRGYDVEHCMPTKDYFEIVGNVHEQEETQ